MQEAWLSFDGSVTRPPNVGQGVSVGRGDPDLDRCAALGAVRPEEYVGPWFPEPLPSDPYEDPARAVEPADSVSMAALVRLSPLERAVFVLREVAAFGFGDIAAAVGRPKAACRRCWSGRGGTCRPDGPGSRRTVRTASSWRHGSSTR